jgi:hypothetical protein
MDCSVVIIQKPKISGTPPAPRYGHSAVLAGSRMIIFGGKGVKEIVYRDLHAFDPISMTWFQVRKVSFQGSRGEWFTVFEVWTYRKLGRRLKNGYFRGLERKRLL